MMSMKIGSQELPKQQTLKTEIIVKLNIICERRKLDIYTGSHAHLLYTHSC